MRYITRFAHPEDKPLATSFTQINANTTYGIYQGTNIFYPSADAYVICNTYNFGNITPGVTNAAFVKAGQPFVVYVDSYTDYIRSSQAGVIRRNQDGGYYAN